LGHRFNQKQLTEMGLIDGQADSDQLMDKCVELAKSEGQRVGWGVWGIIKVCLITSSASGELLTIWQDQVNQSIMDASRSNRPVLLGPQGAKQFWDRVGKDPKAKL
jgi:hypothetical protein